MPESQKVARFDLSTTTPAADAVPSSFSEAPSKQTKRLHQLKPSAKIDLTTHGPVRPEPRPAPRPERTPDDGGLRGRQQERGRSTGNSAPQHGTGPARRQPDKRSHSHRQPDNRQQGRQQQGHQQQGRQQQHAPSAPSSGSTLADLLSEDVLKKLRGR